MKCNVCGETIYENDKFCSNCGQPVKKEEKVSAGDDNYKAGKVAFLTSGDCFDIRGELNILGIAIEKLYVNDILVFDNERLVIKEIKTMGFGRPQNVSQIEKGKNCVLVFGKSKKLSKASIHYYCDKNSSTNYPINFGTQPTSFYTTFVFDK